MHDLKQASADHLDAESPSFLRLVAVARLTGLGRSTIYRLVAQGRFPSPVKLASRAVAWRCSDLERWSSTRPIASHVTQRPPHRVQGGRSPAPANP